jgi:gamma-glutamylcyclotransferase (GGCT)/AIG2-like uncharacterized protein YtfP
MLKVFVYGTLKPGYANYQAYCRDCTVAEQPAMVRGTLFDLPVGYPALISGKDWVKGHLLSFADDAVLVGLDELEDYQGDRPIYENLYQREWVEVFNDDGRSQGWAWAYFMSLEKVEKYGGVKVSTGVWK